MTIKTNKLKNSVYSVEISEGSKSVVIMAKSRVIAFKMALAGIHKEMANVTA